MGLTHEEALQDTERYRILENGAIYDMVEKRIAGNPGGGAHALTPERAGELAALRWDRQRAEFVDGFLAGTPGITLRDGEPAMWRSIGEKTAQLLHDAKSARGFAELLNTVLKITKPEEHAHSSQDATPQALDLAARLVDMLDRATASQPQPIKGRVIDVDVD